MTDSCFLITGGAGFIGAHLSQAIQARYPRTEVVAVDNLSARGSLYNAERLQKAGIRLIEGDVRDESLLDRLPSPDFVVLCAADPSVRSGYGSSPVGSFGTSALGTCTALELASRTRARVILLSSSRVYSLRSLQALPLAVSPNRFSLVEADLPDGISGHGITTSFSTDGPRTFYGTAKLASEMLVAEYAEAQGVPAIINRCGVVAGPWQFGGEEQGFVAHWVLRHLRDEGLAYQGFGGRGLQVRDVLHVQDLCDLILAQVERFDEIAGSTWNVGGGPGTSTSLAELTQTCVAQCGPTRILSKPETGLFDVPYYVSDIRPLASRFGWRPSRTIREIVSDIATWGRTQSDRIDLAAAPRTSA